MTKKELFEQYMEALDSDMDIDSIILYIHMPGGEEEVIINPNVTEKMDYLNKTYDENLVHQGCKDIYITDVIFSLDYGMEGDDFSTVLLELKEGKCAYRKGWNGRGIYIALQVPDENSKMTQPYIYIVTEGLKTDNPDAPKGVVPWLASQTDMLAEDWIIFDPDEDDESF